MSRPRTSARTRVVAALAASASALVLALAPPALGAERVVSAGPLQARVATDPWHLAFEDAAGAPVLSEAVGTGSSADGTLGYSEGGTWFHATRVVDEAPGAAGYSAELATTDPLGGRIRVRLAPDADGVLTLTATAQAPPVEQVQQVGISFAARDGERFLGFGERSNAVDQRGNTIEDYVAEGPYQPVERPAIAGFVPPWGYHPRDDATYFPIPWLLSSAGYGVLVDSDDRSEFHLASDSPGDWSAAVDSSELRMRVFAGPTPAAALGRFTARLGRQPAAAAPWYFGPWFQPKGDDAANLETLRRAGAPASVVQTYTHYLPCGDQRGKEADQRRRTDFFHAAGLAVTTYFNPMICTSYEPTFDEAAAEGDLTKNALGQPYEYRYTGASQFLVGQFDFSSPAARAFYGKLLGGAVADGYDGWMEDFGEYTPTDSVSSDGTPGPQMHNRYPVLYHQAAYEFSSASGRALARFNRSGWTGAARYSQIVWGGDPTTDWGFDGLASAIRNGLTMGLSGVSLWGSDIGGYFSLSAPQLTPELLARWIEFGAVSGIMRTEADGFAIPGKSARPQIFDPGTLPIWRRYAKLRTQLYPYLAAAEREYDTTGLPIMRQLSLAYPDDPAANVRDDEFLFGPDLLAAPVIEPGAATRSLYLPAGQWVDLWRSAAMGGPNASLGLRRPAVVAGGRNISVPAPLDELPLFARAGAILPLLAPDVDTLTSYGRSPGMVHLGDRAGRMRLLAFPRGGSQAAIGPGESASSREGAGGWTFEVRGASERRYALQASLATLERPFIPCALQLGSRRLPARRWTYDRAARVLRASFTLRSGTLVARRSCGLARHNRSHHHRRRR